MPLADSFGLPSRSVKETTVTTWLGLARVLSNDPAISSVWRGQSQSTWSIETRLEREFSENLGVEESRMLQAFSSDATPHLGPTFVPPKSRFDWLSIMQHYGAPTRLLDWSTSSYVAAFFAVCHNPDLDGALWRVDRNWLQDASLAVLSAKDTAVARKRGRPDVVVDFVIDQDLPVAMPFVPTRRFSRMIAQAGLFCLVGGPAASFSTAVAHLATSAPLPKNRAVLEKITIPAALKSQCKSQLETMNIHEATVYPGLEGLARRVSTSGFLDWFHLPEFD